MKIIYHRKIGAVWFIRPCFPMLSVLFMLDSILRGAYNKIVGVSPVSLNKWWKTHNCTKILEFTIE